MLPGSLKCPCGRSSGSFVQWECEYSETIRQTGRVRLCAMAAIQPQARRPCSYRFDRQQLPGSALLSADRAPLNSGLEEIGCAQPSGLSHIADFKAEGSPQPKRRPVGGRKAAGRIWQALVIRRLDYGI